MSAEIAKREMPKTNADLLGKRYDERVAYAFPEAAPPYLPFGNKVIVQLRTPGDFKVMPNGQKIYFADESKELEKFNVQTGLVRCLGPLAYCNRLTGESFPEGPWCAAGEFIRVPKYGGERVAVVLADKREAIFLTVNDTDALGYVYSDPLAIKALL